jgi:hypothetical protein
MQRDLTSPTPGPEPLEAPGVRVPFVARAGVVAGSGVLAAFLSSIPAAVRIADGAAWLRSFEQWLALTALLTPLAFVVVLTVRAAQTSLRVSVGTRAPLLVAAALWWAVVELGVLSLVGSVLRAKTHHHALAGVTFAFVALVSGTCVVIFAAIGMRRFSYASSRAQRVAFSVVALITGLVVALAAVRTARAEGLHTAASLLDLVVLGATAAWLGQRVARGRWFTLGGIPLAVAVLLLGFATVRGAPDLSGILADGAPVHAWLLARFGW